MIVKLIAQEILGVQTAPPFSFSAWRSSASLAAMRAGKIAHDGFLVLAWMLGNVVGH